MTVAAGAVIMLDPLNMTTIRRSTGDGWTGRALGLLHALAAAWPRSLRLPEPSAG